MCYGCKSIFKSASGLMRHIEDNDCAVISQTRLLQEQSKKLIIKEALKAGEGESMPVVPLPADLDDVDGGVRVDLLETENRKAMMNQPRPGKDDPTASVDAMLALKHWPNLGEKGPTACEQPASDLMAFSDSGSLSKEEQGSSTLEKSSPGGGGIFNGGLPDAGQTLRLLDDKWDATKFFNSYTGKYTCICSTTFTAMKDFEHHVLMKSKAKRNVQYVSLPVSAGQMAYDKTGVPGVSGFSRVQLPWLPIANRLAYAAILTPRPSTTSSLMK